MDIYVVTIVASFICSIVALLMIRDNRRSFLKWFTPFLLLTFIVEFSATRMASRGISNTWLYNYFTTLEFTFYFIFFYNQLRVRLFKRFILGVAIGYPVIALTNIIFFQGRSTFGFHTYTVMLGAILIVICCMIFFYELLRYPGTISLVRIPAFWIVTGLLFFYSFSFAAISLTNYLSKISYVNNLFSQLLEKSNILLYILISIGLLCTLKSQKSIALS